MDASGIEVEIWTLVEIDWAVVVAVVVVVTMRGTGSVGAGVLGLAVGRALGLDVGVADGGVDGAGLGSLDGGSVLVAMIDSPDVMPSQENSKSLIDTASGLQLWSSPSEKPRCSRTPSIV